MAVVNNFWLRDNKQKLGGAVIYQAKGQTLMRQLAPSISNPRTDAQMEQRVKLANLVAFYRASAGWMRGAFETKAANQSDYNAFVSANAAGNNVWLTKSQVDAGVCIVAPYTISRGSLGEIKQTIVGTLIASNLYVGALTISAELTIGQLSAALLEYNNGLQSGDQLSLIQYIQNTGSDGNYTIVCRARELLLNPSSTELVADYFPIDILAVTTGDNPALAVETSSFTGGAAFILSRTIGGRIAVSSSAVTLTPSNSIYNAMTTTTQKEAAIRSYGTNTTVFLDSTLADQNNGSVYTAQSIIQLRGLTGNSIPQAGELQLLTDGDEISIVMANPVEETEITEAGLRYDQFSGLQGVEFGTQVDGEDGKIILLTAEGDVEVTSSESDVADGEVYIIIGATTYTWPIQTTYVA